MNRTKIEWVVDPDGRQGYTWNPVTGCRHGCADCYAEKIAARFHAKHQIMHYPDYKEKIHNLVLPINGFGTYKNQPFPFGFDPTFHQYRLNEPLNRKIPTTIFAVSMGDLFGKWVPDKWITDVLNIAWQCTQHKFLFLTKNPKRYKSFQFPGNCWLGTTVTSMEDARRIDRVRGLDNNFLSCEPLLGDISGASLRGIRWIIIGSLNRNGRMVCPDRGGTRGQWAEGLIYNADIADVPVFVKDGLCKSSPILKEWRELPYVGIKERSLMNENMTDKELADLILPACTELSKNMRAVNGNK